jgi:internalin A
MSSKREPDSPDAIAEARIQEALREQRLELDLSGLGLTSLPELLKKLASLQVLSLSGNQLTSLQDWFGKLTKLTMLDLSSNELADMPKPLCELTGLQTLSLSVNQLTSLPESNGKLTSLQSLDLSRNKLTNLPESFGELTSLQRLYLSGNCLTSLPESLSKLTSLRTLSVPSNQLTSLPKSLGKLSSLQMLDLSRNRLTSLGVEIRDLPALTYLFLHENPTLGLPLEVLGPTDSEDLGLLRKKSGDPAAILDYYFRIHPPEPGGKRAGQVLRELKLILVGRGEVGKTSLIEVLKGGKFIEGTKKTAGIAITRWTLMLPDDKATALVWDFGGQEIMHGTHHFFFTRRSLYLVVVDGRHDRSKQDAEYWLKLIRAFGGESPVLVVLNAQRRHAFDTDREYLARKYDVAREHFFRTDCADEDSVRQLQRAI